MGTRADFYVRKESQMRWLGSIAWDGNPESIEKTILESTDEQQYEGSVKKFLLERDDSTLPERGWPWPWNDSRTTDYAYIFENGKVMSSCFGHSLFDPLAVEKVESDDESDDDSKMDNYFPDMSDIKNINWGKGSGLIFITSK